MSLEEPSNNKWEIAEFDKDDVNSHVRFTCPSGFDIVMPAPLGPAHMLFDLAIGGPLLLPGDGSRLSVIDDVISVVDTDKWRNPNFDYGSFVVGKTQLAFALLSYIKDKIS